MAWIFGIVVLVLLVYSPGFRKITGGLLLLAAIAGGFYWGWSSYADRPKPVDALAGVRLGMTPLDVKLASGAPSNEAAAEQQSDGNFTMRWAFSTGEYSPKVVNVLFSGKTTNALKATIICEKNGYSRVFGLGTFTSEAEVVKKLGAPSSTSVAESGLAKFVSFDAYNVAFEIQKGDVTQVCIATSGGVRYTREYQDVPSRTVDPAKTDGSK